MNFNFEIRTKIIFGAGKLNSLKEETAMISLNRWFIIIDKSLNKLGVTKYVSNLIVNNKTEVVFYSDIENEPSDNDVNLCVDKYKKYGCEGIIVIGGGSVIDTGKAVSFMVTNDNELSSYIGLNKISNIRVPLIAIPTTSGTGAEVTFAAGIINQFSKRKMVFLSPYLAPDIAIIDPELLVTLPKNISAETGMDALTHAIEGFVSRNSSAISDTFALEALRYISSSIIEACENGRNLEARSRMMYGQMLAGIAVANAGVCLVHAMGRPLGVYFGIPHGLANAILLPTVTEFSNSKRNEKYETIRKILNDNLKLDNKPLYEILNYLSSAISLRSFSDLGIDRDKYFSLIPKMAQDCIDSGSADNNPLIPTKRDIESLYEKLYG